MGQNAKAACASAPDGMQRPGLRRRLPLAANDRCRSYFFLPQWTKEPPERWKRQWAQATWSCQSRRNRR